MNSFGVIKTKIESVLESSYGKPLFKDVLNGFKQHVLNQKPIAEAYHIYDNLSEKKGLDESIVDEYISESFEQLKNIIDNNREKIESLSLWIDEVLKESIDNKYSDIDKQVYTKNVVKNLESLIESKQRIKNTLLSSEIIQEDKTLNIPLSSMFKIATKTFNKEYSILSEDEKNELKYFTSLNSKDLLKEIETVKSSVFNKLNSNLNESSDKELKEKIEKTINKINESKVSLSSLYKLKQLEKGL